MKNLNMMRLGSLIKKDILIAKNKISSLLFLYILFFAITFFSLREVKNLLTISHGHFITLFLVLFLFHISYIIAIILFPQFIYKESMKEKHEIYFAYQFNVLEILTAKAIILCSLSLLPSYIMLFVMFYPLLVFSLSFIFCIFLAIPFMSLSFIAVNVLLTWFTKAGRIISTAFLLTFVFLLSQFTKIIKPSVNVSYWDISFILLGIAIVLTTGITLISLVIKKEQCIIKD